MRPRSRLFFILVVLTLDGQAAAWVQDFQAFPDGEAQVIVQRFCRSQFCGYPSQREWERTIRSVMAEWNNTGAAFVFREGPANRTGDPCRQPDTVTVILADPDQLCGRDGPLRSGARTEFQSFGGRTSWQVRVYINATSESAQSLASLRRLLLHEFGHAVGLGHPDDAGQNVAAVMNSVIHHNYLQPDDIRGIYALYPSGTPPPGVETPGRIQLEGTTSDGTVVLRWTDAYDTFDPDRPTYAMEISSDGINWRTDLSNVGQPFHYAGLTNGRVYYFRIVPNFDGERGAPSNAIRVVVGHSVEVIPREPEEEEMGDPLTGVLENPAPGAIKSGVSLVSGWVCDAEKLEVSFDGGPRLFVPYGSARADTADICGDTDNGFGLLMNYNNLRDGSHTVKLYADGVLVDQAQFTVKTLGTEFLRGVRGRGVITLSDGKRVTVQWDEATQGFTIIDYQPCVSQIAGACGEDG